RRRHTSFSRDWSSDVCSSDLRYINDSKATNAQAALRALESFSEPVVWIAGGLDRGDDFAELVPHLARRVKGMIAYGESGPRLLRSAERRVGREWWRGGWLSYH